MIDDSKTAIMEAAKFLFAKKGYDKTSVAQIAKEAKSAKSLVYYYFNSKDEILKEVLDQGINDLLSMHMDMLKNQELSESLMVNITESIADKLRDREDIIRIIQQELLHNTYDEEMPNNYFDKYLNYVNERANVYYEENSREHMKFVIEFILVGCMTFHLYFIYEDFIAKKFKFDKEAMWKVFKEIYREDYLSNLYKRLENC